MQKSENDLFLKKWSFTVFCREFYSRRAYAFFVLFLGAKSALVLIFTLLECLWWSLAGNMFAMCVFLNRIPTILGRGGGLQMTDYDSPLGACSPPPGPVYDLV